MSMGSRSLPPPTPEEWERWQRIKDARRCLVLGPVEFVEIHHLLTAGGLRIGHRYTVGLSPLVHAVVKTRAFKQEWPNQKLLDTQDAAIDWPLTLIPAKRDRRKPSNTARPRKSFRSATEAKTLSDEATRSSRARVQKSKRGTHTTKPDKCRIGWTPYDAESSN